MIHIDKSTRKHVLKFDVICRGSCTVLRWHISPMFLTNLHIYIGLSCVICKKTLRNKDRRVHSHPQKSLTSEMMIETEQREIWPRGHSAHTHMGGSVQEIFRQPKNITSASMQPKNISSFYVHKPVHEHKISPNNANISQDCLHRTQKYQYNDVWYKKYHEHGFSFLCTQKYHFWQQKYRTYLPVCAFA